MSKISQQRCFFFKKKNQKTLNIELPYGPAILLLGIKPRELKTYAPTENLYINVDNIIIHNSQKMEQPNCP